MVAKIGNTGRGLHPTAATTAKITQGLPAVKLAGASVVVPASAKKTTTASGAAQSTLPARFGAYRLLFNSSAWRLRHSSSRRENATRRISPETALMVGLSVLMLSGLLDPTIPAALAMTRLVRSPQGNQNEERRREVCDALARLFRRTSPQLSQLSDQDLLKVDWSTWRRVAPHLANQEVDEIDREQARCVALQAKAVDANQSVSMASKSWDLLEVMDVANEFRLAAALQQRGKLSEAGVHFCRAMERVASFVAKPDTAPDEKGDYLFLLASREAWTSLIAWDSALALKYWEDCLRLAKFFRKGDFASFVRRGFEAAEQDLEFQMKLLNAFKAINPQTLLTCLHAIPAAPGMGLRLLDVAERCLGSEELIALYQVWAKQSDQIDPALRRAWLPAYVQALNRCDVPADVKFSYQADFHKMLMHLDQKAVSIHGQFSKFVLNYFQPEPGAVSWTREEIATAKLVLKHFDILNGSTQLTLLQKIGGCPPGASHEIDWALYVSRVLQFQSQFPARPLADIVSRPADAAMIEALIFRIDPAQRKAGLDSNLVVSDQEKVEFAKEMVLAEALLLHAKRCDKPEWIPLARDIALSWIRSRHNPKDTLADYQDPDDRIFDGWWVYYLDEDAKTIRRLSVDAAVRDELLSEMIRLRLPYQKKGQNRQVLFHALAKFAFTIGNPDFPRAEEEVLRLARRGLHDRRALPLDDARLFDFLKWILHATIPPALR